MAFTYDPTTDRGKVRLLCNDWQSAYEIFGDAEIDTFLTLESSNVKRAAALALETIASSEVLVQKVIRLLDISTNGAAESAELLKRAKMMREQADIEEMDGTSPIDYAEMVFDDFGLREHIINENLRDG
jgi:hypothetical protein